jgi:hypothetical protein
MSTLLRPGHSPKQTREFGVHLESFVFSRYRPHRIFGLEPLLMLHCQICGSIECSNCFFTVFLSCATNKKNVKTYATG